MQSGSEKSFVVFTAVHSVIVTPADSLCRVKTPTREFSHLCMTAMKNLLLMTVLSTIMVLAFSPLFSSAQATQAANVVDLSLIHI